MNILGISAFYHDSAACLVRDGEIIAAAQEERFSRKKHDHNFPSHAIEYCLKAGGVTGSRLDFVAFYDKPFLKFERLLETYMAYAPLGFVSFVKAMPLWIKEKIWLKEVIAKELHYEGKILFPEHHESHAASAFYPSPFEEAAFLTLDGVGEWATTSYGVGKGSKISMMEEIHFPHSLGLLYSAFTYYLGFKVNSGEYKVMGLAPYGEPVYRDKILTELIDLKEDGSYQLNMKYFNYCTALKMTNSKFDDLFGNPRRKPENKLEQFHMDLARSIQDVLEEAMIRIARYVRRKTGMKKLCLAGGVALNCVGNGKILREGIFDELWIQPAANDSGGALGAALAVWHDYLDKPRTVRHQQDFQQSSFLGPQFNDGDIETFLTNTKIPFQRCSYDDLPKVVATLINDQKVIGWFQGRMEFGPRALGSRSILGDARSPKMQEVMNLKIKFRESFRPFAPSVLAEKAERFFELNQRSPYMLIVAPVKQSVRRQMLPSEEKLFGIEKLNVCRSSIPAVTHVDYSARVQTVSAEQNKIFYDLLKSMDEQFGCPVVINTSFNVRGEPIVCTPEDAYRCFMRTDMDYLVLGSFVLNKAEQPPFASSHDDWRKEFELD